MSEQPAAPQVASPEQFIQDKGSRILRTPPGQVNGAYANESFATTQKPNTSESLEREQLHIPKHLSPERYNLRNSQVYGTGISNTVNRSKLAKQVHIKGISKTEPRS